MAQTDIAGWTRSVDRKTRRPTTGTWHALPDLRGGNPDLRSPGDSVSLCGVHMGAVESIQLFPTSSRVCRRCYSKCDERQASR